MPWKGVSGTAGGALLADSVDFLLLRPPHLRSDQRELGRAGASSTTMLGMLRGDLRLRAETSSIDIAVLLSLVLELDSPDAGPCLPSLPSLSDSGTGFMEATGTPGTVVVSDGLPSRGRLVSTGVGDDRDLIGTAAFAATVLSKATAWMFELGACMTEADDESEVSSTITLA